MCRAPRPSPNPMLLPERLNRGSLERASLNGAWAARLSIIVARLNRAVSTALARIVRFSGKPTAACFSPTTKRTRTGCRQAWSPSTNCVFANATCEHPDRSLHGRRVTGHIHRPGAGDDTVRPDPKLHSTTQARVVVIATVLPISMGNWTRRREREYYTRAICASRRENLRSTSHAPPTEYERMRMRLYRG